MSMRERLFYLLHSRQVVQLVLLATRLSTKGDSYRNILGRTWVIILRPNQKLPNHSVTQKCGLVFTLLLWVSGWSHKFTGFVALNGIVKFISRTDWARQWNS